MGTKGKELHIGCGRNYLPYNTIINNLYYLHWLLYNKKVANKAAHTLDIHSTTQQHRLQPVNLTSMVATSLPDIKTFQLFWTENR